MSATEDDEIAITPSAVYRRQLGEAEEVLMTAAARVGDRMPGLLEALEGVVVYVSTADDAGGWHGCHRANAWQMGEQRLGEILISAGDLARGPDEVMDTLLHEAVHAYAAAAKISDTSRQGRYHNSRFAELAEQIGLVVVRDERVGVRTSGLNPTGHQLYDDLVAQLGDSLVLVGVPRPSATGGPFGGAPPTHLGLTCACKKPSGEPIVARVAVGSYRPGALACSECGEVLGVGPDPWLSEHLTRAGQDDHPSSATDITPPDYVVVQLVHGTVGLWSGLSSAELMHQADRHQQIARCYLQSAAALRWLGALDASRLEAVRAKYAEVEAS